MFHKSELEKINNYLSLLACGVKDNGLIKEEEEREVLNLSCKCLDIIDAINIENGIITLTPFMYEVPYGDHRKYIVYSVNCSNPNKHSNFLQGYWKCTHCGEGSQFRFYEDSFDPEYYTKCPKCGKSFVVINDCEYE